MSETLLKCRKFDVVQREIRGSDDAMHQVQIIVHPGAVVVLPFLDNQRIVLLHQYRPALDTWLQELPAGTLDVVGEPPDQAAVRELEEEAGFTAGVIEPLVKLHPSPGVMTELIQIFVASKLTPVQARPGPTEKLRVEEVDFTEALRRVRDGEITDAKTMVALMYFDLMRRTRA